MPTNNDGAKNTESYFENIHAVIIDKITKAQSDIRVAVAWFTDEEIIEALSQKAKQGVKVELIIAENDINQKVDFSPLTNYGVDLLFYPPNGYGTMHHKFCIIDKSMVITGSYNWTVNAKKNNGENIMVVKDQAAVDNYLKQFVQLQSQFRPNIDYNFSDHENSLNTDHNQDKKEDDDEFHFVVFKSDFEKEWNIYLNSNVLNYDKEELKNIGKSRAENTQGNPDIIFQYLDTIYQDLLSDTEVDEQELSKLRSRLDQRITFYQDKVNEEATAQTHVTELEKVAKEKSLEHRIISDKNSQEKLQSNLTGIENTKIPGIKNEISKLKSKIENLKQELTPPPLKRRIWIEGSILFILSLYLFVFYSSVIYTILYGRQDANEYLKIYGKLPEIEVFNGEALQLAMSKGFIVLVFIALSTVLPFVFGYLFHQLKKNARWAYLISALLLDAMLAFLITKTVYSIDYQAGIETELWQWQMAFLNVRFWLVLLLGAVPYVCWGALLEHIWQQLDKRSRSELHHKKELEIDTLETQIEEKETEISEHKNQCLEINERVIDLKGKIESSQKEVFYLEHELEMQKLQIQKELSLKQQTLNNQKDKILAYLDKDRIPVSYVSLKDRINTFLSGWDEWLYSFYSKQLANDYTSQAHTKVNEWLKNKYHDLEV